MKKYILGVSAYYHDSAATLVSEGEVVCAVEEERFTRIKHDNSFPVHAIKYCLDSNDIEFRDLSGVAYYEKPLLKLERIMDNFSKTYPYSLRMFLDTMPSLLGKKIDVEGSFRKMGYEGEIHYSSHHLSHAAATFFSSGYKDAAVLTIDGVGEYCTTALWVADKKNGLRMIKHLDFPHSLGLLYSTFTAFLGLRVNNDEYKMMGLAAYGKPTYIDEIGKIVDLNSDGSFHLNMEFFDFEKGNRMWSNTFEDVFGSPLTGDGDFSARHKNIAASIQQFTEKIYLSIIENLLKISGKKKICIGGGVGLNSLANGKIVSHFSLENIHILGPSGDSGASMGAAFALWHDSFSSVKIKPLKSLYLGSEYGDGEIEKSLIEAGLSWKKFSQEKSLLKEVASMLKNEKVLGWFQGRMEFGPRALGSRSILAIPKNKKMKVKLNKIKRREQYRPFAGSIIENKLNNVVEVAGDQINYPHMNFCFEVKESYRKKISAIVHKDNTCRIQTVSEANGIYYRLIKEYENQTGLPIVMNTSFNLAGEPIVETPQQAIYDFLNSSMDGLVIGSYVILK